VGAVVVGAAIVGGVAIARRDVPTPTRTAVPTRQDAAASEPARAERAVAPPIVEPPPPIVTPSVPTVPTAPRAKRVAPPPASDDLVAETELLVQAEAALASNDPERALALARDHATRHPSGQLALEAHAIRIAAACVAGHEGASADADAFLRAHPRSAASAKVRARCESTTKKGAAQ
jgi:hypothetical protein